MHPRSHQRDESSARYFRQTVTEVTQSFLACTPTQQSRFFLWLVSVERLLEVTGDLLFSLLQREGFRISQWVAFNCFLDIFRTSPLLDCVVELSLFHLEREVMQQNSESSDTLSGDAIDSDGELRESQKMALHCLKLFLEIIANGDLEQEKMEESWWLRVILKNSKR